MLAVSLAFLVLAMIAIFFLGQSERNEKQEFRNILFIVADDLGSLFRFVKILTCKFFQELSRFKIKKGWSDVGYGESDAITPTIDILASEGIKLDYAYTYSMCTP